MGRKILLAMAVLALTAAKNGVCAPGDSSAGPKALGAGCASTAAREAPPYGRFFYNYPHEIPPDYVFRTGRVFSPPGAARTAPEARGAGTVAPGAGAALAGQVGALAKMLLGNAKENVADEYAVTVSTFVNLNNLYATSSLGRYLSEQLLGDLQQAGVDVIEVRKSPGIQISEGFGEYGLSRDMDELRFVQPAQAMVVGTYTVAADEIFINARLLRNDDNMVLSTASMIIPVDAVTCRLLADEGMPSGGGAPVAVRAFAE